ncbi:hypothetical protein PCYB_003370, partial [Plasmodium cynomolgi strain B]
MEESDLKEINDKMRAELNFPTPPPKPGKDAASFSRTSSIEGSESAQTTPSSARSQPIGTELFPAYEYGSEQGKDDENIKVKLKELISKWTEAMNRSGNLKQIWDSMEITFEEFVKHMKEENEELSAICTGTKTKDGGVREEYGAMCKFLVQNIHKKESKNKSEQVERENDRKLGSHIQCIMLNVSVRKIFCERCGARKVVEYVFKKINNVAREVYGEEEYNECTMENWKNIEIKWKEMEKEITSWLEKNQDILKKVNGIKPNVG